MPTVAPFDRNISMSLRRACGWVALALLLGGSSAWARAEAVAAVLEDFHLAASEADGERYFAHFAEDAIFLGTDPTERWTVPEFREFAEPYFSAGRGWTYETVERNVVISADGSLAWFDELLDNDSYGRCRGSGVLRKTDSGWRIVQYNLAMAIPNEVARDVASMVRGSASSDGAERDGDSSVEK